MTFLTQALLLLITPVGAFMIAFWALHESRKITKEAHERQRHAESSRHP